MGPTPGAVSRYDRWNTAIADVVFPISAAGLPVYLDLEDDVLLAIASVADPMCGEPRSGLVDAVKATLDLDVNGPGLFGFHLLRLAEWERGERTSPPPTLAVLGVLTLAAEDMRQTTSTAAHNYYDRLGPLLGLNGRQLCCFKNAYRADFFDSKVSQLL